MVRITDSNGAAHFVAADAVARITEAGASSQWRGIKSIVRLFDGTVIEAQEDALSVAAALDRERAGG